MRKIRPGKTTFFVANQDHIDALSEHKVKALAEETEALVERNKTLAAETKAASAGVCVCLCALPPSLALGLCWKG
jgi:phage tail protein X